MDGCFWHVCPEHGRDPTVNEWYWAPKLRRNMERDRIAEKRGTGRWDWFRPAGTRPWGLPLLILGAYGLVGLALLGATLGGALVRLAASARSGGPKAAGARLAIMLLLLSAIDALFNSFLFYPAIAAAALSVGLPEDAAPDRTPAA